MSAARAITPHLWFDKEAREAAELYTSIFPDSGIDQIRVLRDTPSGDAVSVAFHLAGQPFMAISGGPHFTFTPAVSFMANYDPSQDPKARENLERAWERLREGGKVLMPLDTHPFSERYGWVQDRYGLSWQLILTEPEGDPRPFLLPALLFTDGAAGKAEEAGAFYRSVFRDSEAGQLVRYPADAEPNREGTVMFSDFRLRGTWMVAMDSGIEHGFGFNEAVSFMLNCEDQAEIDYFWDKLSAVPESEQCGWLKDRFGVSWQVTPAILDELLGRGSPEQAARVTQAFLQMKKFDIAALERAYESGE